MPWRCSARNWSAEAWENFVALTAVGAGLNVAMIAILYFLFGRVLAPLTNFARGLHDLVLVAGVLDLQLILVLELALRVPIGEDVQFIADGAAHVEAELTVGTALHGGK